MPLTMAEKHAVTRRLAEGYRRAGKKEKGAILDMLCEVTGYNRDHAARLLRAGPPPDRPKKARKNRRVRASTTPACSSRCARSGRPWTNCAASGSPSRAARARSRARSSSTRYRSRPSPTGTTRAVRNKAQAHVFAAIKEIQIRGRLPFPVLGIDSDNGSEFINHELRRYCEEKRITFTRSRACKKNDGCCVEQKNWPVVRRNAGYARFDTPEELEVLNEIHALVRLHTNFFMPSAKLLSKTREGAKVIKRYDTPKTPYARVLARADVD